MRLSELAPDGKIIGPDVDIAALSADSRAVKKGALFAALAGTKQDGTHYIEEAVSKGAIALLLPEGTAAPAGISALFSSEPRRTLAQIAARFYPQQPAMIAAVTGTSGKTSTVQFLRQIWQLLGKRAGSIGTLGVIGNDIEQYGSLTTPDTIGLHETLQMLATEKHITHVAMEASSHGLDQYRLHGVRVRLAAFTNLSRDHLDYHGTMEAYFAAKLKLFTELLAADGAAVLHANIPEYEALANAIAKRGIRQLRYGYGNADVALLGKTLTPQGQNLTLRAFDKTYETHINLGGDFQSSNVLCAVTLAIAGGEDADKVIATLPKLEGVRGRLELVGRMKGAAVYVDYAHKPAALEQVLQTLRPHTENRLIAVFGCGGNRDAGKRPVMGEIASRLADIAIVTDDNPRFEDAPLIRKAVMEGAKSTAKNNAIEIGDRFEAIRHALQLMQAGDVVVIAGKGHESGQIVGNETRPFDDADVARNLMSKEVA